MTAARLLLAPAAAGLLLLTACSGGGATSAAPTAAVPASTGASSATAQGAAAVGGVLDACALFPTAQLRAVMDADPGRGVLTAGRTNGGTCTWKVSDTRTALAQLTRDPDAFLPASIYPLKKTATAVAGTTRGWADASSHSILIVKDGKGVLFTDIAFQEGDQQAYDALAKAVAARL